MISPLLSFIIKIIYNEGTKKNLEASSATAVRHVVVDDLQNLGPAMLVFLWKIIQTPLASGDFLIPVYAENKCSTAKARILSIIAHELNHCFLL
jgi:hypothetical protein